MQNFFVILIKNTRAIFGKRFLVWHFLAIAVTYILVVSGFDWRYFLLTRNPVLRAFFWPAVEIGALVPLFGISIFYIISATKKYAKSAVTAFTLAQAAILGLLTSDLYKFFSGRPGPPGFLTQDFTTDISHVFRFGILRGGIFFGWPSSHTTIAFAMAVTLIFLYRDNKYVRYISIAYALYIGIGVSLTIHWFSDFASGAIIGTVIGMAVGKSFQKKFLGPND
jgi:membrane-associated phospholipid phosphatase